MNVARHHNEWLSLVETSGPFLSLPVLLRVFPQGLDARDPSQASRLRESYEDWLEQGTKVPAVHHAWIRHVLHSLLGYPADLLAEGQAIPPGLEAVVATFNETLRPDMVLKHREADQKPVLLIGAYTASQNLQKPVSGRLWTASPGTRMMELLHAADVPAGLVTNGEEWMLVSARRGETTGFASWYADLWMQEPLTLRAFHSLLHLRRLVGVANLDTLPGLLLESSKDQQEVTDQLGYQVREAVEVLVQAFDRIDGESRRTLLAKVDEKTLYDGALTVMMRLVFLFSAEERALLLLGDPLYDQNYAVSTLSELLRERADQHGEEVLERRHDAWCRLLATFRAVHAGVEHQAMRLPPYGGSLFDPDRYPFLEGRSVDGSWQSTVAKPLVINNRVVLHLLEALQMLRVTVRGGGSPEARRLSFSSLDIEQIGHVYEGLLDHTAKRADEPMLGLAGSKAKEPEVPLRTLEDFARKGSAALVEYLRKETGRSEKALTRLIEVFPETDEHALLNACEPDETISQRVKPFASLLRRDSFGQFVVIRTGSIYVTAGADRRSTGTHYTPRSLTEPIVEYTLEPLAYVGPAEGLRPAEWTLKSPKELLALKVCDMAMGSGAFLVEACRYLADRLVEAWENAERDHPGSLVVTPDGELSAGSTTERLIPADSGERVAIARRYVADRCLYGVDINPMAVEMAKLSLWLITLQRDQPFSFLDHALKCGDSLLGVSSVRQIENFSLRVGVRQITFATIDLTRNIEDAATKRRALEHLPSNDHSQIETKTRMHVEAEASTARVKALADALIAFELRGLDSEAYEVQRTVAAEHAEAAMQKQLPDFQAWARAQLHLRPTFHWPLEFAEVFLQGGFDAFVGNPPFLGGKRISQVLGDAYNLFLKVSTSGSTGAADLCAYFYRRAFDLLNKNGTSGLLATNTIYQADTREVGLNVLLSRGATIYRATTLVVWPGGANVHASVVHFCRLAWRSGVHLDERRIQSISSQLAEGVDGRVPYRLVTVFPAASGGTGLLGIGFVIDTNTYREWIGADSRYLDILYPYLNGRELNNTPDFNPQRYVINFGERSEAEAETYPLAIERVRELVKPRRDVLTRQIHEKCYWKHWDKRTSLYAAMGSVSRVLVCSFVSKHLPFTFLPTGWVYSKELVVIPSEDASHFAILQSSLHAVWVRHYSGTLKSDLSYSIGDGLRTFPLPSVGQERCRMVGEECFDFRKQLMIDRGEGLTTTYNRLHDRNEKAEDISRLRAMHVKMDYGVANAYGCEGLDLAHDFYESKQGVRYTLSESAGRTVLDRILAFNHQRYAEEVKAGLHNKGAKKMVRGRPRPKNNAALKWFD